MASIGELAREASMRSWSLTGRTGLVKVMNGGSADHLAIGPGRDRVSVSGYITQAKYLYGLTAGQLERALGLPPLSMVAGAYIYGLSRLPAFAEIDFRYSLAWPDGKVPTPAEYADMLDRRDNALAGLSSEPSLYPPGGAHIPQWRIDRTKLAGPIFGSLLQHVAANDVFRRDNGSPMVHSPHARAPRWGRIL